MNRLMIAAVMLIGSTALGAQQASSSSYSCPAGSTHPFYNRTDGLCYDKTYKTPVLVTNGEPAVPLDSPVYFMDFSLVEDGEDFYTLQIDGTAFDGTAGVVNVTTMMNGFAFGSAAIVGQTLNVDTDAGSLDVGSDQTDDDGLELVTGLYKGTTGRPFVIGRDPAFKTCLKFAIEDASGTDDFHFGFKRAEALNATFDNYLDLATLSIVTSANPALVQIETINDNAATVTTSTTDTLADATTTTWCVLVSAAGVVTYTINGAAPTATAAFTFDDGDPVVPFIHYLQSADLTGEIDLYTWETNWQ